VPATVGWFVDRNVPWLGARRGLRPRGDVWAAGLGERRLLASALARALGVGDEVAWRVFGPVTLLHRVPAPLGEFAVEVWGHGLRLGTFELGPRGGWVLRGSGALASLLEGLGVPVHGVEARGRLKGKRVSLEATTPAALVAAGSFVGWAEARGPGGVYRVRDMAPRGFKALGESTLGDAAEANRAYLERLASEAREFIARWARGAERVYAAVSGGVDSTVAAALAVEALGPERVELVYADTGMEWGESARAAERLSRRLGAPLTVVRPRRGPLELVAEKGLMGRENRWCTRALKLEPLRDFYGSRRGALVVEGVRGLESSLRARLPRRGVNPVLGVPRLLPILHWTRLEVQLYAVLRGLPVNPLYEAGLYRIGCVACPAMSLHELRLAMEREPGFYERLASALASACGVPRERALEWIASGEWRLRGGCPPSPEG